MANVHILWADDEIDLLKPHVLFLEQKGYKVTTVNSGNEAVDQVADNFFDIVFLDENMPGLSGLEALQLIKSTDPGLPVVMITKSEEESIMEDAIGSKISDYLIKPVNPNQILLSLKKNLDNKRLIGEKASSGYQQEFREIAMKLMGRLDLEEWYDLHRKLIYWGLELERNQDGGLAEVFRTQHKEANAQFSKFVKDNYVDWLHDEEDLIMSHTLFEKKVAPILKNGSDKPVFMVVIDNLRFDQWKTIQPVLGDYFRVETEDIYMSILPTATQYARNALFAGMMPTDIQKMYPRLWKGEEDDGGKNLHEADFLEGQLKRLSIQGKWSYNKITNLNSGKKLAENFHTLLSNKLNVIVYNFVDMLSHARTEMEVIKELADDEAAYRSLTKSWFEHSPLFDILKQVAEADGVLIITTDHGTIRVEEPSKVVGDRNTNSNLRYKAGKNLDYNAKEVLEIRKPEEAFLPKANVSTAYIFATEARFFVYPNNYNHFVNYFKDTFQHGGISMEEMLIPYIVLKAK